MSKLFPAGWLRTCAPYPAARRSPLPCGLLRLLPADGRNPSPFAWADRKLPRVPWSLATAGSGTGDYSLPPCQNRRTGAWSTTGPDTCRDRSHGYMEIRPVFPVHSRSGDLSGPAEGRNAVSTHDGDKHNDQDQLKKVAVPTVQFTHRPDPCRDGPYGQRQEHKPDHLVPKGTGGPNDGWHQMADQLITLVNHAGLGHVSMVTKALRRSRPFVGYPGR